MKNIYKEIAKKPDKVEPDKTKKPGNGKTAR